MSLHKKKVVQFTDEFRQKELPLDILVNNAGIMMTPFELSVDGIEMQFATNYVGHFLLTRRLLDLLVASKPSRIVNVSSEGHRLCYSEGIAFGGLNEEQQYGRIGAYGQSKLANVLFTQELAKRLQHSGVFINALHPGEVATELARHLWFMQPLQYFMMSPDTGALTTLYAATSPEIEEKQLTGKYFVSDSALHFGM
jgi:NAD(P)-dependent dehydrogenase (short-subunit alcohol dehydrogenase family)